MVDNISQKILEEYAYKINMLLDDARFGLIIPSLEDYDINTLQSIDDDWSKVSNKLEKAKKLVDMVVRLTSAASL